MVVFDIAIGVRRFKVLFIGLFVARLEERVARSDKKGPENHGKRSFKGRGRGVAEANVQKNEGKSLIKLLKNSANLLHCYTLPRLLLLKYYYTSSSSSSSRPF